MKKPSIHWKPWLIGGLTAAVGALINLEPALAKTAGELGEHWAGQGAGVGKAMSALFYLGGMAAGGGAFLKLKANRDSPQQHPLSHAFALGVVCAGLLFLPTTFKTAGDTIYTNAATKNEIGGTTTIGN